uniref:Uncharacterized protein n=1 Tax=Trypanosoma vivax (strain Y486) TaxID=1055687 RepID=G0TY14_TRYVY|nr:hypothetical protein, unlikely [Trypanosoma vivax Y486]
MAHPMCTFPHNSIPSIRFVTTHPIYSFFLQFNRSQPPSNFPKDIQTQLAYTQKQKKKKKKKRKEKKKRGKPVRNAYKAKTLLFRLKVGILPTNTFPVAY